MVYWYSEYIAIGLLTTTCHSNWPQFNCIKEVNNTLFTEAWLCVVMRFLHHNTSQVCTVNLKCLPAKQVTWVQFLVKSLIFWGVIFSCSIRLIRPELWKKLEGFCANTKLPHPQWILTESIQPSVTVWVRWSSGWGSGSDRSYVATIASF